MSENRIKANHTDIQTQLDINPNQDNTPSRPGSSRESGPLQAKHRVAAVVMECNPFHQGHRSILHSARSLTGAEYVIVLMSGDYVQRGEPAILSKEERTRAVLENGADLVLELPVPYATGAADWFARGAISILAKLGVVTDLVFGSGSGDLAQLETIAGILQEEPEEYRLALKAALNKGLSYPAARARALKEAAGLEMPKDANDILGIEYLRALRSSRIINKSCCNTNHPANCTPGEKNYLPGQKTIIPQMIPHAVRRVTEDSASALRVTMREADPLLPSLDDYSSILLYRLWQDHTSQNPISYADVTPDLARRILHYENSFNTCSSFISLLKSKNYTYTRLSRSLLHIILNITQERMAAYEAAGLAGYARVLGFRRQARPLLSAIAQCSSIPLILQEKDSQKLSFPFREMLQGDIAASEFYDQLVFQKAFQNRAQNSNHQKTGAAPLTGTTPEYSKPLIIAE